MLVNGKWRIDLNEPHQVYRNREKKRVPGVTTVLGVLEKVALRGWYAQMEREGVLATLPGPLPEKDGKPVWFADIRKDKAADIGTVTHARCEAFVKGPYELDEHGLTPELLAASMPGFLRFQELWVRDGLTLVHSELQMVSEAMQVGGTADIIVQRPEGLLELKDLKTSKASKWWPYDEVIAQVAAYATMFEEVTGRHIDRISVERIGKEADDPGQTYVVSDKERAAGLRLFRAALEAYNAKKEMGR